MPTSISISNCLPLQLSITSDFHPFSLLGFSLLTLRMFISLFPDIHHQLYLKLSTSNHQEVAFLFRFVSSLWYAFSLMNYFRRSGRTSLCCYQGETKKRRYRLAGAGSSCGPGANGETDVDMNDHTEESEGENVKKKVKDRLVFKELLRKSAVEIRLCWKIRGRRSRC